MRLPGAHIVGRNIAAAHRSDEANGTNGDAHNPSQVDLQEASSRRASLSSNSSSTSSASVEKQDFTHEDTEWQDVEQEEGDDVRYRSLFDTETFGELGEMLQHCKERHGVDIKERIKMLGGCVAHAICIRSREGVDLTRAQALTSMVPSKWSITYALK